MKKLAIVLLLGLLIAGSAFAQWGYVYTPAAPTLQTITGTLQIINGVFAIVSSGNQVYYVPSLRPYYGVNGMYINSTITVYGSIAANNYFEPFRFMVYGTWFNLPVYNYYYYAPSPQTIYVPMYAPPSLPRVYPGRYVWCGSW